MVLRKVWALDEEDNEYVKLSPYKEYKFHLQLKEPGMYHFVCGLPHHLNVNKSYQVDKANLTLRHKMKRGTVDGSKYSLKLKIKIANRYLTLIDEKRLISLQKDKVLGEVHINFNVKPKYLSTPLSLNLSLTSKSLLKRLRVAGCLYKDEKETEHERNIMRCYLKHVFEGEKFDEAAFFERQKFSRLPSDDCSSSSSSLDSNSGLVSEENEERNQLSLQSFHELGLSEKDLGDILLKELFSQKDSRVSSQRRSSEVIDLTDMESFRDHIQNRDETELKKTILDNLRTKYPRVNHVLVENPYKKESLRETEKESTFLSSFQIQFLNYECLPKTLQFSTWKQRFNSNIFGHNLNEIIRLCSSASEPQLIVIKDGKGYVFGGFLKHGLYMKNTYNKDAVLNFPSVYHANFSLLNYDISEGYSDAGDESESFVFSFLTSDDDLCKYSWTKNNRMFRLINKEGFGMGGGGEGFAFFVDSTVQFGSSGKSETYENEMFSGSPGYSIQSLEIWGFESGFHSLRT